MRRLIGLAGPQLPAYARAGLIGLTVSGLYVAVGVVLARAIGLLLDGAPLGDLAGLLALAGVLLLGRSVATWLYTRAAAAAAGEVKIALRERLYRKILSLGPAWTNAARTGQVQGMLTDGIDAIERVYSRLLLQTAVSFVAGLGIALYIVSVDAVVGGIVLAGLLGMPAIVVLSKRVLRGTGELWWQRYAEVHATYVDHLQGIATLKVLGASRRKGEELQEHALDFRDATIATMTRESLFSSAIGASAGIGGALSVGLGALHVADGQLALADLLLILFLARECFRPLSDLTSGFHMAYYGIVLSQPLFELLDTEPAVIEPPDPVAAPVGTGPPPVTFEGVSFRYPGGDTEVVRDLDLRIASGETVALVGRSGAGKSTCAMLLLRLLDPIAGRITVGGVDITELGLDDLRRQIALVAQDTHLFGGTVRDNLLLARPDARDDQLWAAVTDAAAERFVRALPAGLDTQIGERGVKLSGGERQRIAIARALLADRPILLLDEATSSVDVASEAAIQAALDRLRVGRTTLVIAHRLSTVHGADRVVVLDDGEVVEQGRPGDLVGTGGAFAQLVATQRGAR